MALTLTQWMDIQPISSIYWYNVKTLAFTNQGFTILLHQISALWLRRSTLFSLVILCSLYLPINDIADAMFHNTIKCNISNTLVIVCLFFCFFIWLKDKTQQLKVNWPEVMKNCPESPWIPIVPGPVLSANTLISENAPLMMPNPNPDTEIKYKWSNIAW